MRPSSLKTTLNALCLTSVCLLAGSTATLRGENAETFEAWLSIFETSSPLEQDRLLSEAERLGWLSWDRAHELWENPSHRPWILSSLDITQIKSMDISQWSPALRSQLWIRGLSQNFGGDELKALAKKSQLKANGNEKRAIQALLGTAREFDFKNETSPAWSIKLFTSIIQKKDWNQQSQALALLEKHLPNFKPDEFKTIWKSASPAGLFIISSHLCTQPQKELSLAIREAFDADQEKALCLYMLYHLSAHQQSEWLLAHVSKNQLKDNEITLALKTLNHWNEIKEDRRYLDYFLNHGYHKGGPGADELLILVGKSKHPDASRVISRFFKESENNPFPLDIVTLSAGYHGAESLIAKLKSMNAQSQGNELLTWALERCSGKHQLPWIDSRSKNQSTPRVSFGKL